MLRTQVHRNTVDRIAGWIVGGRFRPGDTLPIELAIGEELAVSRTVVREALKSLTAKGLVDTRPRLGTRVRPFSSWNLFDPDVLAWRLVAGVDDAFVRDLLELRQAIEPAAARLAASAARDQDLATMEGAYRGMVAAVEGRGSYLASDLAFHESMLTATHNQFIAALVPAFSAFLRVSFHLSVKNRSSARASLPGHRTLLDAIAGRNVRAAEKAASALIDAARVDIESDMARDEHFLLEAPA